MKLRTRATIYIYDTAVSASGEPSQVLVEFGQFWCGVLVRPMSIVEDGKIKTTISRHDLTFRYSAKLATLPLNAVIKFDGVELDISGIDFDEYKKKYIRMTAAARR